MTNQIHIEIYVSQIVGMAQEALENYYSEMIENFENHVQDTENWNKNRNWLSRFVFGDKTPEANYKHYYSYMSDKHFVNFLNELINLPRSKGTTGEKVKLSIDLNKWNMLTKYYGGFNE